MEEEQRLAHFRILAGDYIQSQWIDQTCHWFKGAAVRFPSINNWLEAQNAVIKREHTLRERFPVGQFLSSAFILVKKWSERRNPTSKNCVSFTRAPTVSLKVWTGAHQWRV